MKLDGLPGLELTLMVDGADMLEYSMEEGGSDDTDSEGKRYVEARPGSEFGVCIRFRRGFTYPEDTMDTRIHLDGQYVTGIICNPERRRDDLREVVDNVPSFQQGRWVTQRFQFASLKTTDSTAKMPPPDAMNELGIIKVVIRRGRRKNSKPMKPGAVMYKSSNGDGVPEKSLKGRAISAQTTVGAPRPIKAPTVATMEYPYGEEPIATFRFLYRSRNDLQIEGIIERSPTPVPLEDRDPETWSLTEAREVARRVTEREKAATKIKQEFKMEKRKRAQVVELGESSDDDDDLEVSFSGEGRKRARTANDPGVEVIDLCDD